MPTTNISAADLSTLLAERELHPVSVQIYADLTRVDLGAGVRVEAVRGRRGWTGARLAPGCAPRRSKSLGTARAALLAVL